eukprot:jgi/Chlat1/4298/Chrsp29S04386
MSLMAVMAPYEDASGVFRAPPIRLSALSGSLSHNSSSITNSMVLSTSGSSEQLQRTVSALTPIDESSVDEAVAEDDDEGTVGVSQHNRQADTGRYEPAEENFKVVVRIRPPLKRELESLSRPFRSALQVDAQCRTITITDHLDFPSPSGNYEDAVAITDIASEGLIYSRHTFNFDYAYDQHVENTTVYNRSARSAVLSTLQGYNATILAYGQTGTGKTYTMEGGCASGEPAGIIPRACEDIFEYIRRDSEPNSKWLVRAAHLQIYNEVISDLLKPERTNLQIREDKKRGVFVEGLSEWVVRSPEEIAGLMERGAAQRATATTRLNEMSSRSHAIFIIIVENSTVHGDESAGSRQSFRVGKLNLVDLAGSERVRLSGASGRRLEESKKINQSLSALGNVIAALTEGRAGVGGKGPHVPYRDSKLTRILEDSLGGNCRTTMVATIAPGSDCLLESLSTLKFAARAKRVRNAAHINEDVDQKTLLRKYERELKRLRAELEQKSRNVVDKRRLLELEEQRRRAEADKLAAITALEARSREFMREKAEKRKLEERIVSMQSQLLVGGEPASLKMRREYEARLAELERERQAVDQDKAQVDRYKQLLLKQRDIMMQLTERLNERDEQIIVLQEEMEASERHRRKLEDRLDMKTAELIAARKALAATTTHNNDPNSSTDPATTSDTPKSGTDSPFSDGREYAHGNASTSDGPMFSSTAWLRRYQVGENGSPRSVSGDSLDGNTGDVREAEVSLLQSRVRQLKMQLRELVESSTSRQKEADDGEDAPVASTSSTGVGDQMGELQVTKALEDRVHQLLDEHETFKRRVADELAEKNRLLEALEVENKQLAAAKPHELDALKQQVVNHSKERAALRTILEVKVKSLVDSIGQSLEGVSPSARHNPRLAKEVKSLDRLVAATVNAMRASDESVADGIDAGTHS